MISKIEGGILKRVQGVILFLVLLFVILGCDMKNSTTTTTTTTTTSATQAGTTTTTQAGTTTTQAGTTTTTQDGTTTTTTQGITTTSAVTTQQPGPIEGSLLDETAHLFARAYHWYTIHVDQDGLLKAYTLGMLDTYGAMYDANYNLLFEDDESGWESNFMFDVYLRVGTYHILVMGYDEMVYGDYRIVVEPTPKASLLINTQTTLIAAEEDRYEFTLTQPGFVVAYTMGFVDTFGEFRESDEFKVATSDDDGTNDNIRFEAYLLPGDYAVVVRGYDATEVGDYRMIVYFIPKSPESHDLSTAAFLPAGGEQNHSFTVDQTGYLTVYTVGDVDTYGKLLDSSGDTVVEDDDGGFDGNFWIDEFLEPGVYTVVVTGYDPSETGDYRINFNFVAERFVPHLLTGEGSFAESFELWYEVTVAQSGYLYVYTESRMDTYGYLYDSNMNLLAEADDSGGYLDFLLMRHVEPGTYKILVTGSDPSPFRSFRIFADFEAGPSQTPYYFSAYAVMTSGVGGSYQVILTEPGYLMAFTASSIDTYGTLFDAAKAVVAEDDDSYGDYNFFLYAYVEAGTYEIVIEEYDEDSNGDFLLIVNFFPFEEYSGFPAHFADCVNPNRTGRLFWRPVFLVYRIRLEHRFNIVHGKQD